MSDEMGALCAGVHCGDGVLLVDEEGAGRIPAFEVEAVDTTGCGDAFSPASSAG